MKQIFFLFTALFLCMGLSGQGQFFPGYYISNQGDTIQGYINNQGDMLNAKACHFRVKEDAKTRIFYPGEIEAYYISNQRFYRSLELPGDDNTRTFFVEYLVDGITDFYYLRDIKGNHFYIESPESELIELPSPNDKISYDKYGNEKNSDDNRYKGILKYYMKDQPQLFQSIDKLSYKREKFIEIADDYHNLACTDNSECIVFSTRLKKNTSSFSANFHTNRLIHSYEPASSSHLYNKVYLNEFGLGLNWHVTLPNLNNHLLLSLGLDMTINKNNVVASSVDSYTYTKDTKLDFDFLFIGPVFDLQYNLFPQKEFSPFVHAFAFVDYGVKHSLTKTEILYYDSGEILQRDVTPPTINPGFIGTGAGIGTWLSVFHENDITVNINYLRKKDSTHPNSSSTMKGFNLAVDYYF